MVGAALFIVGEMTGSGILGVPCALAHSGYSGFGMMLLCVVVASYTGLTLSRNWMHVRDHLLLFQPLCSISGLLHWKRLTVRLCFVILSVAICEAIPRFDLIMSLIGGTTINAAVFILPSIFHFKLAKKDKWWNLKITFDSLSIVFGLGAGVVCTYASVAHIVDEYSS
eukprot:sb/3472382/